MTKNPRLKDVSGQRFGSWLVLNQDGNTPRGAALWNCLCDCGSTSRVNGTDLRSGKSRSCGCVSEADIGNRTRTHGRTGDRVYRIWQGMRARCNNPSNPCASDYGGRGITVCDEWSEFTAFAKWAESSGYRDDLSIERVDVNGGYSPSNCTWADAKTQSANRRYTNKAPDGELWLHKALRNGVSRDAFYMRMRNKWPLEQAISWPMGVKRAMGERDGFGRFRKRE